MVAVRVGFLGAGLISSMHLAFLAASSVEHALVAVHDTDPDRADSFARRTGARVSARTSCSTRSTPCT